MLVLYYHVVVLFTINSWIINYKSTHTWKIYSDALVCVSVQGAKKSGDSALVGSCMKIDHTFTTQVFSYRQVPMLNSNYLVSMKHYLDSFNVLLGICWWRCCSCWRLCSRSLIADWSSRSKRLRSLADVPSQLNTFLALEEFRSRLTLLNNATNITFQ